jgi:hypothetical protein
MAVEQRFVAADAAPKAAGLTEISAFLRELLGRDDIHSDDEHFQRLSEYHTAPQATVRNRLEDLLIGKGLDI